MTERDERPALDPDSPTDREDDVAEGGTPGTVGAAPGAAAAGSIGGAGGTPSADEGIAEAVEESLRRGEAPP